MSSVRTNGDGNSSSSSGSFTKSFLGTFTTCTERKFWSEFTPLEKLGEGSFGSVVAAVRTKDDLPVAVKTVSKTDVTFVGMSDDDEDEPEEVFALRQLEHLENVIQVINWKETSDKVIIVMERPENSVDLKKLMRQKGGMLSEAEAQKIINQLASCVNKLMEQRLLHRDLKPSNILVNKETLKIKVIDFGLTSDVFSSKDVFRDSMGTHGYLPPEFIEKRDYIAGPAMVWTIGIITYQILIGCRPFYTNHELLNLPLRIPARLSPHCRSFISGCLSQIMLRLPLSSLPHHAWFTATDDQSSSVSSPAVVVCSDLFVSGSETQSRKRKADNEDNLGSWSGRTQTPPQSETNVSITNCKSDTSEKRRI